MLVCPVDLDACKRAACRRGVCELTGAAPLVPCWECGSLEMRSMTAVICAICLHEHTSQPASPEVT